MKKDEIKKAVREGYASVVKSKQSCSCGCGAPSAQKASKEIGYTDEDIKSVPDGANLGLGCGNPVALASIKEGEVVVDLGSGAGFDCFLASKRVGETGKVIGIDMTPDMLDRARENARQDGYTNVEFRLGEIENLPVANNTADLIISNCVINLSTDKQRVFEEAYRILKDGGRLMVSDIVLIKPLPDFIMNSARAYIGCLAGASLKDEYLDSIRSAGFRDIEIVDETAFSIDFIMSDAATMAMIKGMNMTDKELLDIGEGVRSIKVSARK